MTNYYEIDPAFGTEEDLRELIAACHERGIKLILDLPINHTSKDCRWYKNFLNAHLMQNPENEYYDFYSWLPAGETAPAGRHFMKANGGQIQVSWLDGEPYVTVPDLICFFNLDEAMPQLNPYARVGEHAAIIALPAAEEWTTERGLEIFGPRSFGYDIDYKPFC